MTTRPVPRFAAALLAGLSLALAGCASAPAEPAPAPPAVTETPAPTPTPEPEPEPAPVTVVPATCDELLPPEVLARYDSRLELHSEGEGAAPRLEQMLGPATWATVDAGEQGLFCGWGIPQTDGGASIAVAVVDEASAAELLVALRDSVFEEVEGGPAPAFLREASAEHQFTAMTVVDGDLIIALASRVGGIGYVWEAYDAVRG